MLWYRQPFTQMLARGGWGRQQFGNTCCGYIDCLPHNTLCLVNDGLYWMTIPHTIGLLMIMTTNEDMNTLIHILCVCYTRWLWLTMMNKHIICIVTPLSTSAYGMDGVITKVNHTSTSDNTVIYDTLTIPTTHWQHIDTSIQLTSNITIRHNDHTLPRKNTSTHHDIDDTINTMSTHHTLIRRFIIIPTTHRQYHTHIRHTTFTELEDAF